MVEREKLPEKMCQCVTPMSFLAIKTVVFKYENYTRIEYTGRCSHCEFVRVEDIKIYKE